MAQKRKAQEAFGKPNGQLSAVAAAKQARQRAQQSTPSADALEGDIDQASAIADTPYDVPNDASSELIPQPDVEEPVAALPTTKPSVRLSNFLRNKSAIPKQSDREWELSLKADEYVTFVGEFDIEVSKGVVSIYGAMLHSNSGVQRVYALSTQAIPAVVARKDSVVKVTALDSDFNESVLSLERVSPLFSNIGAKHKYSSRSFTLLKESSDDPLQRPIVPLEVDDETKRVLSRLNARLDSNDRAPRILAVGAKSAGKSTFNRLLCNMIITRPGHQRLFYLDIDPGQPEFGPPGQVTLVEVTAPLLGPAFTHLASADSRTFRLVRSHTIAATSFKDDPGHYVNCVIDLAKRIPQDVPVVVNSCGWVSGLGASVSLDILAYTGITDSVALGQVDAEFEDGLKSRTTLHTVARRQGRVSARTPADLRAMQTLAYFHQKEKTSKGRPRWSSKCISHMRPWIVGYSGDNAGIEAILSYGQAPQPDFLGEVLDGSLVAIVAHDPNLSDAAAVERTSSEDLPYIISKEDGFSFPIDPQQSKCLGLGLIRGIDVQNKKFQLVTPLPESQVAELLQRKVVLVRGGFDSPEWAYLEDLHAADKKDRGKADAENDRPWVTWREPVGVEGSVWRLRHPPTRDSLR
ncbi:hypothetical protein PRZ48_011757 [Zasmidium cellare]|uniref:Polynucleotide 5'-hydroxyl-kinase GRC3 n=1 Tax=Zasmidium cellare TaxID=395010 RepID=A0ABR0E7A2_ZASCE|nr:hypothetical protein PRZ48_011757 [Zasmidium cellare]